MREGAELPLLPPPFRGVYRVITASILIAWWARGDELVRWYLEELWVVSVEEAYFPAPLTEAWVLAFAYITPTILGAVGLARPTRLIARTHAATLVLCALVLLLHQVSLGFQGANTALWAGVFLFWLASVAEQDVASVRLRAAFLAQLLLSLIFLGGAAGKWTESYWSGEVMYHLMFLYQDGAMWTWLRETLSAVDLRNAATWYSRGVVIGESLLACVVLLPPRIAFRVATIGVVLMWLGATLRVIDAVGPVLGLAIGGWLLTRAPRKPAEPD